MPLGASAGGAPSIHLPSDLSFTCTSLLAIRHEWRHAPQLLTYFVSLSVCLSPVSLSLALSLSFSLPPPPLQISFGTVDCLRTIKSSTMEIWRRSPQGEVPHDSLQDKRKNTLSSFMSFMFHNESHKTQRRCLYRWIFLTNNVEFWSDTHSTGQWSRILS